jgi:hypothetical protein
LQPPRPLPSNEGCRPSFCCCRVLGGHEGWGNVGDGKERPPGTLGGKQQFASFFTSLSSLSPPPNDNANVNALGPAGALLTPPLCTTAHAKDPQLLQMHHPPTNNHPAHQSATASNASPIPPSTMADPMPNVPPASTSHHQCLHCHLNGKKARHCAPYCPQHWAISTPAHTVAATFYPSLPSHAH